MDVQRGWVTCYFMAQGHTGALSKVKSLGMDQGLPSRSLLAACRAVFLALTPPPRGI